jgi:polyisoprenoid-binding protein YceI
MAEVRRRLLIGVPLVIVLGLAAIVGVFLLRGGNEPPPPALSATPGGSGGAAGASGAFRVADGSFVGYRVRETFASIGVTNAVGRTRAVSGTVTVEGDRLTTADLTADLSRLRSDEDARDEALRTRGIETDRFPRAEFELAEPVAAAPPPGRRASVTATGRLTLHGVTRPIRIALEAQRTGERLELVGDAPIRFADFDVEPPSVAGFVTVRDEGRLEFRLLLEPR